MVNLRQRLRRTLRKYSLMMISSRPKFGGNCGKPLMSSVVTLLPPATNSSLMSEYISKTNQQIPAIPSWTVKFLITLIF